MFKADFNKAFDYVNWAYLDSFMEQMKFGTKWRNWIKGCLESGKASVIINGSPTTEFYMTKGVRQGDPLSPFLFIIAMEGLNMAMKTAVEKGVYEGINSQILTFVCPIYFMQMTHCSLVNGRGIISLIWLEY